MSDSSKVPTKSRPGDASSPAERNSHPASLRTREEIVRQASAAFATQGFQGATLRGIARRAGVDHSTLIHHFGNKEGLLMAVLRWRDKSLVPVALPTRVSIPIMASTLVSVARQNQETAGLTQLFSTMSAEAGAPEHPAREYLQSRHQAHLVLFAAAVTQARLQGWVEDNGLSAEAEAGRIVATWEGLEVFDRLHPGVLDVPEALEATFKQSCGLDNYQPGTEADEAVNDVWETLLATWTMEAT